MSNAIYRLSIAIDFHDEWPARVGKFIADPTQWYATHSVLVDVSAFDIASFLCGIAEAGSVEHIVELGPVHYDAAGQSVCTDHHSAIYLDHLRWTLTFAAFDRYGCRQAAQFCHRVVSPEWYPSGMLPQLALGGLFRY